MVANEWQPIETAPCGVEVLVFAPAERPAVFTAEAFDWGTASLPREWSRQAAGITAVRNDYFGDPDFTPTHWMPLPEPPCEETTTAASRAEPA